MLVPKSSDHWLGEVLSENQFEKFENEAFGLRAGLTKLRTMYNKGFVTIRLISKYWASTFDYDDAALSAYLESKTRMLADQTLKDRNHDMCTVAAAITSYFNGDNFGLTYDQVYQTSKKYNVFLD